MVERITIGDTEVEVRETDDGFEAVEVSEDGPFLAFVDDEHGSRYGGAVPVGADVHVEAHPSGYTYSVAWRSEDEEDVDGLREGSSRVFRSGSASPDDYDRSANVDSIRVVESISEIDA